MKGLLSVIGIGLFVCIVLGGVVTWKVSVWNECRLNNSFMYCWSLVSK
jgi:hypothetical protein